MYKPNLAMAFATSDPTGGPDNPVRTCGGTRRILVIDDDPAIGLSCKRCLEPAGYAVDVATEPLVGLGMALTGVFDVVLLDLALPGVDGLSILQRLRQAGTPCEVVVITGFATVKSAVEALKAGAADYLSKPFTPDELRAAVERAGRQSALLRENRQLREQLEALRNALHPTGEKPQNWSDFRALARRVRRTAVLRLERAFLAEALARNGGNVTRTARSLGIQRTNLHALLRRHGLRAGRAGGPAAAL